MDENYRTRVWWRGIRDKWEDWYLLEFEPRSSGLSHQCSDFWPQTLFPVISNCLTVRGFKVLILGEGDAANTLQKMLLVQKLHYVSKVVTYGRRASPTGPTVQIWLSLIRASGRNSEDPSLSPGWISMFPATEKKKQKKTNIKTHIHTKKLQNENFPSQRSLPSP